MLFRSVKIAETYIKLLRFKKGYSSNATSEWRRLSLKLSDSALIQYARRLAARLETDRWFLVGVDEQDFHPKIYVLHGTRYCILSVSRRDDEQTKGVTYALGHVGEDMPAHLIDVSQPPTGEDLAYALSLIDTMSSEIIENKDKRNRPTVRTKPLGKNRPGRRGLPR